MYVLQEPGIFEAMSLLHSRIRRVIFCYSNKEDGGLGGIGSEMSIHSLSSTNHRYRAFQCINDATSNELFLECERSFKTKE
jgi:tRNA-specific adenosine deaminase 3